MPSIGIGIGISLGGFGGVITSPFDPDASAAFAYYAAVGAPLPPDQKSATNQLFLDLKGFNLWPDIHALFLCLGPTATVNAVDAKRLISGTFFGTVVQNSNGFTGDGATGYFDPGIDPSAVFNPDSFSMGVYPRTDVAADVDDIGGFPDFLQMGVRLTGNASLFDLTYNGGAGRLAPTVPDSRGLFMGCRTASNAIAAYRNGVLIDSSSGTSGALPSSVTVGALAGAASFSPRNYALVIFASGWDATKNSNFHTANQVFQTALGRQV